MYKIACIMGKSSSGKDHIYKALLEKDELNLKQIIMYTTRPKRSGEKDGVEYYFTSEENADAFMKDNRIIEMREYDTVYGVWKYFTADDGQIDLNTGRYLVIGTLEVYEKFCSYYGKDVVMPIYVDVDDGIRLERALKREKKQAEPKYKEMCRRFLADCEDFSEEKLEAAGICKRYYNNGAIEDCIDEIAQDIRKEML
ncbi:MAG: guanylate kinase [Lachnospiraceae bacterium]